VSRNSKRRRFNFLKKKEGEKNIHRLRPSEGMITGSIWGGPTVAKGCGLPTQCEDAGSAVGFQRGGGGGGGREPNSANKKKGPLAEWKGFNRGKGKEAKKNSPLRSLC